MTGRSEPDGLPEAIEVPDRRFALGVLWHPEDRADRVVSALVAAAREEGDGVIEVVEPATGDVMAEVPRAGAEETDAAVARAKAAFPDWRAVSPGDRAALLHALADALDAAHEDLAAPRPATPASRSAMPAPRCRWSWRTLPFYAGAPERLLGDTIPVAWRRGHDLPRAARRGGPDRPLELPARDRLVEGRAGARAGNALWTTEAGPGLPPRCSSSSGSRWRPGSRRAL